MSEKLRIIGKIQITSKGTGFVTPADDSDFGDKRDIFIGKTKTGGAFTGDTVEVELSKREISIVRNGGPVSKNRREGRVVRIIEKSNRIFSGSVYLSGSSLCVMQDGVKISGHIKIVGDSKGICGGDKVLFEMIKMPIDGICDGEATVIEVVGKTGEAGVDISAMIKARGINTEFPEDVMEEALSLPTSLDDHMVDRYIKAGRRDLRDTVIVTIDGEDTKDVDDGVSIERLLNGHYKLGVHIADVSEYVKHESPLDREAYERGTSVYLPDRVIPMLPRSLSNGICSLNVGEVRLAFSVIMEIDEHGEVVNHDIFESIINVKYKISYDKLYELLENHDTKLEEQYRRHISDLNLMRELAGILNRKRNAEGSVNFEIPETKVIVDNEGKTIDIMPYRITFANNIIEEFMLICNQTVSEHFYWMSVPFLYRVHDKPDTTRVAELARVVKNLGFSLKGKAGGDIHPKAFQNLIVEAKDSPAENLINLLTLRAMQKAVYSSSCLGHFGLSMKYYSHFTSPIRRYPDLLIHRIMKKVLKGEFDDETEAYYKEKIAEIAEQCSMTERRAFEAERDCVDFKCCEYMKQFEGEEFVGTISSITGFGIFVVLDNTVEGLIRYTSMRGYYDFDSERMTATEERSGRVLHIGSPIRVILSGVNVILRQIDFIPANESMSKAQRSRRHGNSKKGRRGDSKKSRDRSVSNKKTSRKGKRR